MNTQNNNIEYYKEMCIQLTSENLKLRQELEAQQEKRKTPLNDFFTEWLEIIKSRVKPDTYSGYSIHVEKHFKPYFKDYFLETITSNDIEKYFALKLCDGLSRQTVKSHRSTLRAIFSFAYKHDMISENVVMKTDAIKTEKFDYHTLPFNEIWRLLEITKNLNDYPPILLSSLLGLRRSEALGLRWSDIDFDNRVVNIKSTCIRTYDLHNHKCETVLSESTKNATSRRSIPLSDFMVFELKRIKQQQTDRAKSPKYIKTNLEYVCLGLNGGLLNPNNVSRHFKKILKDNDFDTNVRFHDLRHSCATYLHNEFGFDLKDVSVYLGHSDVKTTGNIYIHETMNEKIANTINSNLESCYNKSQRVC